VDVPHSTDCALQMRMSGLDAQLKDLVELVRTMYDIMMRACFCQRADGYACIIVCANSLWYLADLHRCSARGERPYSRRCAAIL
jgi:hypothetical protein